MPTSLRALCNNDVRPRGRCLAGLRYSLHAADQPCTRSAYSGSEWARIAKREHDCSGLVGKGALEQFGGLRKAPGVEATADPGISGACPLPLDPVAVAVAATDQAKPALVAHSCGEPATGDDVRGR